MHGVWLDDYNCHLGRLIDDRLKHHGTYCHSVTPEGQEHGTRHQQSYNKTVGNHTTAMRSVYLRVSKTNMAVIRPTSG